MLSDFIKKKKRGVLKAVNMENIQNAIGSAGTESKLCPVSDVLEDRDGCPSSPHTKRRPMHVENSFVVGCKEILASPRTIAESVLASPNRPFAECGTSDIEARKLRVMNHATRNIEVKYDRVNAALYLPKSFKVISTLYRIISTICNFNKKRDLSLILVKYKDSIERLFKHRVEMSMLEQLNFIANGTIRFIPVEVLEGGARVSTFKIDIVQSIDIDFSLFNYFCEVYRTWLANNDLTGPAGKIHPEFLAEDPCIPRKAFGGSEARVKDEKIRRIAKEKAGSILDRIKEKERLRREGFVKEHAVDRDYEGRLESLFEIGGKMALKMSDVLFKLGGFDIRSQILKVLGKKYAVRRISGEEYIVKVE